MNSEVANLRKYAGLEISGEIVRFSKQGGRSHLKQNTPMPFLHYAGANVRSTVLIPPELCLFGGNFGFNFVTVRNARHGVNLLQ